MSARISWEVPSGTETRRVCGSTKLAVPRKVSMAYWEKRSRMRVCSRAVTRPRRPISAATVMVSATWRMKPWTSRRFDCRSASAVSRSALEGMVPVLAQAPPGTASFSMTATFLPRKAARVAPRSPAGPLPTMATS